MTLDLEQLIQTYGYWTILGGTFLEGETILALGGFAAHRGYLHLPWVILAAFAGTLAGDQLFFYLGRRHTARFLARHPARVPKVERATGLIDRHETLILLVFLHDAVDAVIILFIAFASGLLGFSQERESILVSVAAHRRYKKSFK
jgi:hypothetical protein